MSTRSNYMARFKQYTEDEAKILGTSRLWQKRSDIQVWEFQMMQDRLCVPLDVFHKAAEVALKRSVLIHELTDLDRLWDEYLGLRPKATMEDIIGQIPSKNVIVLMT